MFRFFFQRAHRPMQQIKSSTARQASVSFLDRRVRSVLTHFVPCPVNGQVSKPLSHHSKDRVGRLTTAHSGNRKPCLKCHPQVKSNGEYFGCFMPGKGPRDEHEKCQWCGHFHTVCGLHPSNHRRERDRERFHYNYIGMKNVQEAGGQQRNNSPHRHHS